MTSSFGVYNYVIEVRFQLGALVGIYKENL